MKGKRKRAGHGEVQQTSDAFAAAPDADVVEVAWRSGCGIYVISKDGDVFVVDVNDDKHTEVARYRFATLVGAVQWCAKHKAGEQ